MGILRFTIQATGFLTFVVALFVLISHSLPEVDFLHDGGTLLSQLPSAGFLTHLVAAILLGGAGYLLISWGRNG